MRVHIGVIALVLGLAACDGDSDGAAPLDAAATVTTCDPIAQGGCPTEQRCTFVDPESDGITRGCRPAGAIAEGAVCTRTGALGDDDCAAGLFCTFIGVLPPEHGGTRRCRRACSATAPCDAGERCAKLVDDPSQGMCGPTCVPFASGCAGGMTCAEVWTGLDGELDLFAVCRPVGATPPGTACDADTDCTADHVCLAVPAVPRVCRPLCDANHPCTSGQCYQPETEVGVCI